MEGAPQSLDPEELLAHAGWVRTLAVALVGESRADDLAQQTMLRAMERPPRHRKNLRGWLGAVARNFAINATRKESRRRELLGKREYEDKRDMALAGGDSSLPAAPDDLLGKSEAHTQVISALMDLKDPGRHLLMLRFFEDLSPTEIAQRHNMKPSTVRVQLMRALDELRLLMKTRHGGDGMAPCLAILTPALAPKIVIATTVAGSGLFAGSGASVLVLGGILTAMAVGVYLWEQPGTPTADPFGVVATAGSDESEHDSEPALVVVDHGVSGAPQRVSATPARLRLAVHDQAGSPLSATLIRFHRLGSTLGFISTNPDGLAELPAGQGDALLQLSAQDHAPWLARVELGAAEHNFVLPRGALLAGKVELDETIQPGTFLALSADTPLYREDTEEFAWLGELDPRYASYRNFLVSVQSDGSFQFEGLPDGWTGTLASLDPHYKVDDRGLDDRVDGKLRIAAPARDLRVSLLPVPQISGRILMPEGTNGGLLNIQMGSAHTTAILGPGGRFEILQDPTRVENLELVVQTPEGYFGRFAFDHLPPDGDLGELELEPLPVTRLKVQDEAGQILHGASVWGIESKFLVRAPGMNPRLIDALGLDNPVGGDAQELVVTLQKSNLLDLRVLGPDGEVAPGAAQNLQIRLEAKQGLLSGSPMLDREFQPLTGTLLASSVSDFGIVQADFRPDAQGSLLLPGIRPAAQIFLTVRSASGKFLLRQTLPTMPAVGVLQHGVTLPVAPRSFQGQVIDPQGRAVAGAKLLLRNADSAGEFESVGVLQTSTDLQGRFVYPQIYSEMVQLRITAAGAAMWSDPAYTLPPSSQDAVLRLAAGRTLDLQVLASDGSVVQHFTATAALPELGAVAPGFFHAQSNAEGQLRLSGLPIQELELKIQAEGWTYLLRAPQGESQVTYTLPPRGVLQVSAEEILADLNQVGALADLDPEAPTMVVRLEHLDQGIETILNGGREILHLPAGEWRASVLLAPRSADAEPQILASRRFELSAGLQYDLRMN
jgi:RNA polymerase sigma factor (sigma-70 family)